MRQRKLFLLSVLVVLYASYRAAPVHSANILGVFTTHLPSHLIIHMSIAEVLAERGHNVTVVASQVPKIKDERINIIVIEPTEEQEKIFNAQVGRMALKKNNFYTKVDNFFGYIKTLIDMQADVLKHPRFTDLYKNSDTKFDLVIVGYLMNTFQYGVAAKFKAPLVVSWTISSMLFTDMLVGNPSEVSFVPDMDMAVQTATKMSFLERLRSFASHVMLRLVKEFLNFRMQYFYWDLFPNDPTFPTLREMERNVSLLFCNSHFSEGPIRPNVPAVIEIGGIQIRGTPQPLPEDIATHLKDANETGLILLSLGSNLKGLSVDPQVITRMFNVLSKLRQKVIWKWEDLEATPGHSSNILYKKWMPQEDILAHPHTKLFITHAGKGGMVEALYYGVPMVALPIFSDQHVNAQKIVASEFGQKVELLTLTEGAFSRAIQEVLHNKKYKENVQHFSTLYRDRPLTARESVAFWTDYVLRHHGAAHMQSPLVHMSLIESCNLDVFLFLTIVCYLKYRLLRFVLSKHKRSPIKCKTQ